MTNRPAPLLELFMRLRGLQLPLGVEEYKLALEALAAGFGVGSREELTLMCQTVWAKSREEQELVRRTLDAVLPRRLSDKEVAAVREKASPAPAPADEAIANRMKSLAQRRPPRLRASVDARPMEQEAYTAEPGDAQGEGEALEFAAHGAEPGAADLRRLTQRLERVRREFVLKGRLPVGTRQLQRGWRFYRHMRRFGPRTELDVRATVEQIHRLGELIEPVLVARSRNLARLLILVDEGGSMTPFRQITDALLDSAQQGDLGEVSVFYFNNVPGSAVFRDRGLSDPVPLPEVLKPHRRAGVLIASDAGAARGYFDELRLKRTVKLARTLRRLPASVAWLNPTPESRWVHTTAEAIARQCAIPMFTIDAAGLVGAVETLRGRGR